MEKSKSLRFLFVMLCCLVLMIVPFTFAACGNAQNPQSPADDQQTESTDDTNKDNTDTNDENLTAQEKFFTNLVANVDLSKGYAINGDINIVIPRELTQQVIAFITSRTTTEESEEEAEQGNGENQDTQFKEDEQQLITMISALKAAKLSIDNSNIALDSQDKPYFIAEVSAKLTFDFSEVSTDEESNTENNAEPLDAEITEEQSPIVEYYFYAKVYVTMDAIYYATATDIYDEAREEITYTAWKEVGIALSEIQTPNIDVEGILAEFDVTVDDIIKSVVNSLEVVTEGNNLKLGFNLDLTQVVNNACYLVSKIANSEEPIYDLINNAIGQIVAPTEVVDDENANVAAEVEVTEEEATEETKPDYIAQAIAALGPILYVVDENGQYVLDENDKKQSNTINGALDAIQDLMTAAGVEVTLEEVINTYGPKVLNVMVKVGDENMVARANTILEYINTEPTTEHTLYGLLRQYGSAVTLDTLYATLKIKIAYPDLLDTLTGLLNLTKGITIKGILESYGIVVPVIEEGAQTIEELSLSAYIVTDVNGKMAGIQNSFVLKFNGLELSEHTNFNIAEITADNQMEIPTITTEVENPEIAG